MQYISDLHVHSKYSRAVSKNMSLPVMAQYASQKGLDILSTSDWMHPLWFKEIQAQLEESADGLYSLKEGDASSKKIKFILSVEISSIFKQGDKLRRIHNLLFVPDMETASKFSKELLRRGCNLSSDGRPIVGISSKNILDILLNVNKEAFLIPCHVWTPHFGLYGSASGFDSIEESFGELSKYIYGIETGISSDPDMNWQIEDLKNRSVISNSDAHSPAKMGREATVFVDSEDKDGKSNVKCLMSNEQGKISYNDIRSAIMRKKDGKFKIGYTIEFYPEEGKYHYSGHRNCKVVQGPEEIRKDGSICPVCKKELTEGVLYRVSQLSSEGLLHRAEEKKNAQGLKWYMDKMKIQPPFVKLVPLNEVVAESMFSTVVSKKVMEMYTNLCANLGSEMYVLMDAPLKDIEKIAGERTAEGVAKVRQGDIAIDPGYDGEYGRVRIWKKADAKKEKKEKAPQLSFEL